MTYTKNAANPVFLVALVDQYGAPVVGVTAPTVYLSKSQAGDAVTVQWVESTDFTWHELTSGERFKGVYKLRQTNAPNVSAVNTEGRCVISVYETSHDAAAGGAAYTVEDRSAAGSLAVGVADAVWDEAVSGHSTSGSFGQELHLAKAMLANKREHTVPTGVDVVKDNDGTTTLRTMTPSSAGDVITVTPS